MTSKKGPPKTYLEFVERYPGLGDAWERAREAERAGPLDRKTARLIKLGIACGALRQGAVSSAARKARGAGASEEEIAQVVALAASTVGFSSAVALFSWMRDQDS